MKVWKWEDAELEEPVLGLGWAGIYSPREFSWALAAELCLVLQPFQTCGCPRITLWWGVGVSQTPKAGFLQPGQPVGNEPCAGCYPCTVPEGEASLKAPNPKEPREVTLGVTGGLSRDRLNTNRGREYFLTPQPRMM